MYQLRIHYYLLCKRCYRILQLGNDPVTSAKIDELIVQMQKLLGVTSIVVTHDMKSAFYIADRIAMLYQGEMIAIGTPDEIRNSTDSRVLEFINVSQIRKR